MLKTVTAEKVDEKNGVICLVSCFLPELWSLNCPKSTESLLKQSTYMHLKVLIILSQKMLWFIGV